MTIADEDRWRPGWRAIAAGTIVAGVVAPPVLATVFAALPVAIAAAIGMAIIVAGAALHVTQTQRAARVVRSAIFGDLRVLGERVERCMARLDLADHEIAGLTKTVAGEQRNLGMVSGGLGEMRQIVRHERDNLGLIANGVDEMRTALRSLEAALRTAGDDARLSLTRLDESDGLMRAFVARLDELHGEVARERRNLGMVAGALDDVRRQAAGVHLFSARQAAFEDVLIAIADRFDATREVASHEESAIVSPLPTPDGDI